jgi:tetratricopeptide (TPR) repeat protein
LLAELEVNRRDFNMAVNHISGALDVQKDDPRVWATQGHLNFLQQKWEEAKEAYETVLSLTKGGRNIFKYTEPDHLVVAYNRLGCIYLKQALGNNDVDRQLAKLAKSVFLQACQIKPTSFSWLGVGRAAFALEEIEESEDAYSVIF